MPRQRLDLPAVECLSILDAEGLPYYVFSTANIGDAPLTPVSATVNTNEGAFFSGVVGSFNDAAGPESRAARSRREPAQAATPIPTSMTPVPSI